MVNCLIIEDEPLAYEELKRMLGCLRPDYNMAGWAVGVVQAVTLLRSNRYDLIFADISLSDGLCFDIFTQVDIDTPVIFTTAFDEYAIRAFKANGIDYLLKPVDDSELEGALVRFERHALPSVTDTSADTLARAVAGVRSRFLVQSGDTFRYVLADDIAFFHSEDKYTFITLFSGRSHIVDHTLDALDSMLDRRMFHRVSRGAIVNIRAINSFSRFFAGRLKLDCTPQPPVDMYVSRSRAKDFFKWIEGQES